MTLIYLLLGLILLMIIISAYKRTKQSPSNLNRQTDNSAVPIIPSGDASAHGKSKGGYSEGGSSDHSASDSSGGDGGGGGGGGGGGD
ncbi:hypothetical protein D3P07_00505 [Paenibacillus sp. 1011MAR3C5]|uniref:hypothetical protein n=1 Tax=Paenibacillus sp. 1011MAR3C5 TaxID=1675787 RepID=UPI000E6CCDD1|nr:hypothetical protein [Paenibacillus sp. 1011MAR3C5]RJE90624.1 hypothetical protein D3P07_00505 [Paenibacillus sp. 1011MAR3C5]